MDNIIRGKQPEELGPEKEARTSLNGEYLDAMKPSDTTAKAPDKVAEVSTPGAQSGELNNGIDWSMEHVMGHPGGVEKAVSDNIALMEQRTKELIETGSTEDLQRMLDQNTLQLQLLQERMANIGKMLTA